MKKLLLFVSIIAILGVRYNVHADTTDSCSNREQLEKIMDEHKLQTLVKSYKDKDNVREIMITPLNKGEVYIIDYNKSDKDKKYCIVSITNETTINDSSISILYKALERVRGYPA